MTIGLGVAEVAEAARTVEAARFRKGSVPIER